MKKHDIQITKTGGTGSTSGRPLYRVECKTCGVVIHEGTTGPDELKAYHLEGLPGYERSFNPTKKSGRGDDHVNGKLTLGPSVTFCTDEKGLQVSVGADSERNTIALHFNKETSWVSMKASEASDLAHSLLAYVQSLQKENRFHRKALKVPTDPIKRDQIVRWVLEHPLWTHPQVIKIPPKNLPIDQAINMEPGPDWKTKVIPDGSYLDCVQLEFVYVNPETESIEDEPTLNTAFRVWVEAGGWVDKSTDPNFPSPPEGWTEYNKWVPSHDPDLNCGGDDLESALIELGLRLKFFYKDNGSTRKVPVECNGYFMDEDNDDPETYVSNCTDAGDGYCVVCGYAIEKDD